MMQEDEVAMNDEEINDSEIVMVANLTSRQLRKLNRDADQSNMVDTQLKALGLYEEGMSAEQKEELLAVVAASRMTAQQEETMRLRAKEWQQKVYPSDVELGIDASETIDLSSPSVDSPKVESSMQMLNLDQQNEGGSQELFDMTENEVSSASTKRSVELPTKFEIRRRIAQTKPIRRVRRCPSASSQSRVGLITVHQSPTNSHDELDDYQDEDVIQVDFGRQKKELERSIPLWKPCSSPEGSMLNSSRLPSTEVDQNSEHKEHCQRFLHSLDEFYLTLDEHQRKSNVFLSWGQPVTVGRAYATRSTRSRTADSENSDAVYSFHPANEDPANSANNMCEYYMRLRQFNQNLEENSGAPNRGNTVSVSKKHSRSVSKAMLQRLSSVNTLKRTHDGDKNDDLSQATSSKGDSSDVDIDSLRNDTLKLQRESIFGVRKTLHKTRAVRNNYRRSFLDKDNDENTVTSAIVKNSNILRNSGNSETTESKENVSSSTRLVDGDMPGSWDQENYIDVVEPRTLKRRKCSSIRSLNSPKRLKEAGATS